MLCKQLFHAEKQTYSVRNIETTIRDDRNSKIFVRVRFVQTVGYRVHVVGFHVTRNARVNQHDVLGFFVCCSLAPPSEHELPSVLVGQNFSWNKKTKVLKILKAWVTCFDLTYFNLCNCKTKQISAINSE